MAKGSTALDTLKASELEKSVSKTVYGRYRKNIDSYIVSNLKNSGDNVSLPIIQVLVDEIPSLKKSLLELYDKKMALDGTGGINEEIKILQASLFDGLVFGLNMEKGGEMAIYTANFDAIFSSDADSKFNMAKTVELNRDGVVNAIRIDIEYTSEDGFMFKPVGLNKNTNLRIVNEATGQGRFYLVPYIMVQRYMAFFKEMLDSLQVLEVHQDVNGMDKMRYITNSRSHLAKYCDDPEFVEGLESEYFPLKGFFYAPVLGAPSTTLGRTRVNLIDVCRVDIAKEPKVEKPKNVYRSMVVESVIGQILEDLYTSDTDAYLDIIETFPKSVKGSLVTEDGSVPSPVMVSKYFHGLNSSAMSKVEKLIPGLEEKVAVREKVFDKSKYEVLDVSRFDKDTFKKALKSGVYKVIIRKKDCLYSSMIVSNSNDVLRALYGEDYFGKYESLGTRLYKLEELVNNGIDVVKAMGYCGFDTSDGSLVARVGSVARGEEGLGPDKNIHDGLEELFTDSTKKKTRRSSSNDSLILARRCFASADARDFYAYLDLSKVTSLIRIG